jgi:hypothetical protein
MAPERPPVGTYHESTLDNVYDRVMNFLEVREDSEKRAWDEYQKAQRELKIVKAQSIFLTAMKKYPEADWEVVRAYAEGLAAGQNIDLEDYKDEINDILEAIKNARS